MTTMVTALGQVTSFYGRKDEVQQGERSMNASKVPIKE